MSLLTSNRINNKSTNPFISDYTFHVWFQFVMGLMSWSDAVAVHLHERV